MAHLDALMATGASAEQIVALMKADIIEREAKAARQIPWQRLRVLEETTDGFRVAEADLKLRGPGELLGQNQSGLPALRFGNLTEDGRLVERARAMARQILG